MRQYTKVISTTRVDAHGDILQRDDLERMAARMAREYTLVGYGHDIRHPPIGRIVSTRLIKQEDGEYVLEGTFEIWDKNDDISSSIGDGRKIKLDIPDYNKPTILYNPLSLNQNDLQILSGIAKLGFQLKDDRIEKAYDPAISSIIFYGSIMALGAFITGVFNQLGQEAIKAVIKKLKELYSSSLSGERLVIFKFPIIYDGSRHELDVVLEKSSDVEELSKCSSKHIEELVKSAFASEPRTIKVVIGCTDGEFHILYSVRDDGAPSIIAPILEDELIQGDLSSEGTAKRTPHR